MVFSQSRIIKPTISSFITRGTLLWICFENPCRPASAGIIKSIGRLRGQPSVRLRPMREYGVGFPHFNPTRAPVWMFFSRCCQNEFIRQIVQTAQFSILPKAPGRERRIALAQGQVFQRGERFATRELHGMKMISSKRSCCGTQRRTLYAYLCSCPR